MTGLNGDLYFATTRKAGLHRLQEFATLAGANYAQHRNTDYGPAEPTAVSRLSPYIRHRLISESEVLSKVLAQQDPKQADKFVQEVFWRTYFKGHLEHKPYLWSSYRQHLATQFERLDQQTALADQYQCAIGGMTGIEPFDLWAQELIDINYLHNHTRMWFASIWIFTLELPWQLGADFFMQHLLDGDPASNTLSWRWVAGLHTRGKHYLARADNIAQYSNGRFTNICGLNESAAAISEAPAEAGLQVPPRPTYHIDQLPGSAYSFLLHEDDLHWPELTEQATAIAVLDAVPGRAAQNCATTVRNFVNGACGNVAADLAAGQLLAADAAAIARWARDHSATTLVTPYPPVGPVRDLLDAANTLLKTDHLSIQYLQRSYDSTAWPHCK
ncbi:MAG: FAD-binding domain-containing protein, partial [Pseudomonadales bacterium]